MRPAPETNMEPWIIRDPAVLGGKPCIRGTRISVDFLLELVASGASKDDILSAYPQISADALAAAFQYAAASLRDEFIWDGKISA